MDSKIVNPFLKATADMFTNMFQLNATANQPYIMTNFVGHRWEVSGVLGITGDAKGVVAVRFHWRLVNAMLDKSGVVYSENDRDDMVNSIIGEVVNIASGNAIANIDHYNLDISPPITIQGDNHNISWPRNLPVICIPFRTHEGDFEVDLCFAG